MRYFARFVIFRHTIPVLRRLQGNVAPREEQLRNADINVDFTDYFSALDIQKTVAEISQYGAFTCKEFVLPPAELKSILNYAQTETCYINGNKSLGIKADEWQQAEKKTGSAVMTGHFFNVPQSCNAIAKVSTCKKLYAIAESYLKTQPHFVRSTMWWSFPTQLADAKTLPGVSQAFHKDIVDYKFLKFFFYATEVDDHSGPHQYVLGSHKASLYERFNALQKFSDDYVLERHGPGSVRSFTLPAGRGFIADTWGIHKGKPPKNKPRLMIEIVYAVSAWQDNQAFARDGECQILGRSEGLTI